MKAVILAGGLGTRMRPLTYTTPKPLLPILNVPMLQRLIERLPSEVDGVVLAVNYLADQIREHLEAHPTRIPVELVEEAEPLGTGGAVKNLEATLGGEAFFVLNSDVVCGVDLGSMRDFHRKVGAVGTIHVWPVEDPSRYGVVELGGASQVLKFTEKPAPGRAATNLINAGTYILEPAVLARIPAGRAVSMEREVFPLFAGAGLYGFQAGTFWVDAGKPLDYLEAHRLLMEDDPASFAPPAVHGVTVVPPSLVPPTARLEAGATVGPNACLGAGVHVARGARVSNSVLLDGARVGEGAVLDHAVVGKGAAVGAGARLAPGTVVADGVSVEPGRSTGEFESVDTAERGG